ncbi:MAG: twin-arginine translocase subunit TatC [Chthoniobacteraceae bacterium]|nr:twin-arginine translocase subunit TatC [Chthoniobacteraceae bacterium]
MALLDRLFQLREDTDQPKPFLQHLEELRWTCLKMAAALFVCMAACLVFQKDLVRLMEEPLNRIDPGLVSKLQNLGVIDPITISFSLAFYAGIVFAFPLLLFFLAQFVLPGLTRREKKVILPAIAAGTGLFLTGVALCYFVLLPETLRFCFNYSKSLNFAPSWTVREYFSFVTQMMIAFGAAFELPVVVAVLVYLGILSFRLLNQTRPYAYVLVLFLAAVLAPTPDPISFLALGAPMCLLYEACIWMAWLLEKRRERSQA